jgi:molybdenum cofactor guanylyltransferase
MAGVDAGTACWPVQNGGPAVWPSGSALIAGLILAGGGARRLGGVDKPLLALGSSTILAHIIAVLGLEQIAISANGDAPRFADYGLPVLDDGPFAGEGPLAGILAGLDWSFTIGATALLSVPGDTPFLPPALAVSLSPPPACAATGDRIHHLVALWPVSARITLRDHLSRPGARHVARFAATIGMRQVDFPPSTWDSFLNVNTRSDLEIARSRVTGAGSGDQASG